MDTSPLFPTEKGAPEEKGAPNTVTKATRVIGHHMDRFAPAYLRGVLYISAAAIINFGDTFGKLTSEESAKLSALGWTCLVLKPIGAAITAAIAFLDQTLARINAKADPGKEPGA
jgi:hypothetical protein